MSEDIRLSVTFWDHPKTKKLIRNGGYEAIRSLQKLWCYAAQERQKGILYGMDIEDIEIAADWQGEDGLFIKLLIDGRWIDFDGEHYALHGWAERQSYVCSAPERYEQAKKAALARWKKEKGIINSEEQQSEGQQFGIAENSNELCCEHAESNAENSNEQCPPPFSSLLEIQEHSSLRSECLSPENPTTHIATDAECNEQTPKNHAPPCPHGKIVELWHEVMPELQRVRVWSGAREKHLAARWREQWKAEKFKTQADGINFFGRFLAYARKSDFLMGKKQMRSGGFFRFTLPWLILPENFFKVLEGNYENKDEPYG